MMLLEPESLFMLKKYSQKWIKVNYHFRNKLIHINSFLNCKNNLELHPILSARIGF